MSIPPEKVWRVDYDDGTEHHYPTGTTVTIMDQIKVTFPDPAPPGGEVDGVVRDL